MGNVGNSHFDVLVMSLPQTTTSCNRNASPLPPCNPIESRRCSVSLGGNGLVGEGIWGEGAMKTHGLPMVFSFFFATKKGQKGLQPKGN